MAARLWSVVVDCHDPIRVGRWWAEALGWQATGEAAQEVTVEARDEDRPFSCVFVPVPEPKAGKNRLHLDLASTSWEEQRTTVDRLLARGAARVDIGQRNVPWVVLADSEGNEFCMLEPRERYRGTERLAVVVVVDAADPVVLADFWAAAAGWPSGYTSDDVVSLHRPRERPPDLEFVRVADAKTGKNHIPSDLVVDHWTSDGESSSHRDVLLLHDVWTTANRLSGHKITSTISMAYVFTTQSGGR